MKKSEFNNNHKDKYDKFKTLLSIFSFKRKRYPDGILMKQNPVSMHMAGCKNEQVTTRKLMIP